MPADGYGVDELSSCCSLLDSDSVGVRGLWIQMLASQSSIQQIELIFL